VSVAVCATVVSTVHSPLLGTTALPVNSVEPSSSASRAQRQKYLAARIFLLLVLVIPAQSHLESARWWWSPTIVAALGMTPEQSMAVEMLCEDGLPARMRAREQFAVLEEQIRDVDRWAKSDDEFYSVTADLTRKLADVRTIECDLRRKMLDSTSQVLAPEQRQRLAGLIRQRRVMESTCPTGGR
jgi:hypothetical protein